MLRRKNQIKKVNWSEQIAKLHAFTISKKWNVKFASGIEDNSQTSRNGQVSIQINTDHTLEKQLYFYLHECGHALEIEKLGRPSWINRYFGQEEYEISEAEHRISRIHEEMNAWDHGLMLAKELGIIIIRSNFESIKSKSLLTYISWAKEIA